MTKKGKIVEINIPYSKLQRGTWCTKTTKFSKQLVDGVVFTSQDARSSETREFKVFDIVAY